MASSVSTPVAPLPPQTAPNHNSAEMETKSAEPSSEPPTPAPESNSNNSNNGSETCKEPPQKTSPVAPEVTPPQPNGKKEPDPAAAKASPSAKEGAPSESAGETQNTPLSNDCRKAESPSDSKDGETSKPSTIITEPAKPSPASESDPATTTVPSKTDAPDTQTKDTSSQPSETKDISTESKVASPSPSTDKSEKSNAVLTTVTNGNVKNDPAPMETLASVPPQKPSEKPTSETTPVPETDKSSPAIAPDPKTSNPSPSVPIPATKQKPSSKEDGEQPPEKKAKVSNSSLSSKGLGKSPEQILEYMDKTFDQRRKTITKQMPTIPELKLLYPDLFTGKQLLIEFQRITKIDIDQKIQEFCVRYATAVIEMAREKKGSAPVLARWEQAKQETETLKQYWDMVTALCLLPLHFGESFGEMVLEIGEDEEVVAQGKIVPTLVARGSIFRTDEFFLIAENTIVQEFEEFTIAFASLYSSYWVFNMVYPDSIENTYNYIQRCIVRQREPGSIPNVCKNFTKALQKWNKGKDGK